MPSRRASSPSNNPSTRNHSNGREPRSDGSAIGRIEYRPGGRPLLAPEASSSRPSSRQSEDHSIAGSFFSDVAEGIVNQDRKRLRKEVIRYLSFVWAIINCLGAGSITAYSLYAPLFQRRLHYSQLQVNGVSITAELAMYLPVPLFGLLCDRYGPGVPSLLSGSFFGFGYLLAAFAYKSGPPLELGGDGWPYWVMVVAFIGVGGGTSCMYLSAVTTCAKNFGRGRYKGIALALPIACFGLSGMWQSQIGSNLLYERLPGGQKGDVDVHRYFLFLGGMLLALGVVGFFALRVVGEDELIDEAVSQMERSGLLEDSDYFQHMSNSANYGSVGTPRSDGESQRRPSTSEISDMRRTVEAKRQKREAERAKKTWLLNAETRRFLSDRTMWWLAAGFFLVTGPGEAFINNLGTIIGTLYPPHTVPQTNAATHVSLVALTSTIARILTGTLADLFAPSDSVNLPLSSKRPEISRLTLLLVSTLLLSVGQLLLASTLVQHYPSLFAVVSSLIGAGYGAVFSLVPICVSVIWGVENFGTNWAIVATMPAVGATVWSVAYGAVYQWAASKSGEGGDEDGDVLCYGSMCYAPTFWAMAVSVWVACGLWMWAWKGPGGWKRRGIAV